MPAPSETWQLNFAVVVHLPQLFHQCDGLEVLICHRGSVPINAILARLDPKSQVQPLPPYKRGTPSRAMA